MTHGKVDEDYRKVAEVVRELLIRRLAVENGGHQFAMICFRSLARDDRLKSLLWPDPYDTLL